MTNETNILETFERRRNEVSLRLEVLNGKLKEAKTPMEIEAALQPIANYLERVKEVASEMYKINDRLPGRD